MKYNYYLIIFLVVVFSLQSLEAKPKKEIIISKSAPEPIGPYSQAVKFGDLLFISGQIAINPNTNQMVNENIETETKQVMENIKSILQSAGYTMSNIIKTTIYLTDLDIFKKVNEIYGSYFEKEFPARETVQVAKLPKGANIEVSVIAGK